MNNRVAYYLCAAHVLCVRCEESATGHRTLMLLVFVFFRHPDKSSDPLAESKFVEIKKAYELLSDTERRSAFDLHGVTHEDAFASRNSHDYSQYGRFASDPFEEFFG